METLPFRPMERWLFAATIFVVIAYSWLLARVLEPRMFAPRAVVTELTWLKQGRVVDTNDLIVRYSPAAIHIQRELAWMNEALKFLGPFRMPPVLVIAMDEKDRSVSDDERVLISGDIATREAGVLKALLKSWLYQNAAAEITSSYFRMDVAAEFLSAVVRADLQAPALSNWLTFASSFESSHLDSVNRGISELWRFSGRSTKMNPLGFKQLLLGMMCELYLQTPRLKRFEFLRSWVQSLRWRPAMGFVLSESPPESLGEWRTWLLGEFNALISGSNELKEAVISRVGLNQVPTVSFWFKRSNVSLALANLAEVSKQPIVVERAENDFWLVGPSSSGKAAWTRLNERDRAEIRTQQFVWEGCESMRLGDLLDRSQGAERLLVISACDRDHATETGWRAFLSGGLREFARARPETPFVQLKRSAVELALRHRKISPNDKIGNLLTLRLNPIFGSQSAQWSRELHAYRLIGAIEAIEWIRGSPLATAP